MARVRWVDTAQIQTLWAENGHLVYVDFMEGSSRRHHRRQLTTGLSCDQALPSWFRSILGVTPAESGSELLLALIRPLLIAFALQAYRCGCGVISK